MFGKYIHESRVSVFPHQEHSRHPSLRGARGGSAHPCPPALPAQTLHLLPLALGLCERLEAHAHVEDLVPVLPHHEAGQEAHQGCHQVQSHLQEEVQAEQAAQAAAVARVLVQEGPAQGVSSVQLALAGLLDGVTGEPGQLQVVVSSKGHCQNTGNQSQGAQEKIQQLKERKNKRDKTPFSSFIEVEEHTRNAARILCRECISSVY